MGTGLSRTRTHTDNNEHRAPRPRKGIFAAKCSLPMEVQVAHYTPASFPLIPVITPASSEKVIASWDKIVRKEHIDENGVKTAGITVFYNEFYEHLYKLDTAGQFEAVLARHVSGGNQIAAKGAIIVRIIKYVCTVKDDSPETYKKLYTLGKMHSRLSIRPWQYSVFVQTLLLTISSRLGTEATNDVMDAWVNVFAFVLRSMLPPAIKGQVDEYEININTSSSSD